VAVVLLAAGAVAAGAEDREKAATGTSSAFTLGLVQKELRTGLSQAEVVERLGSPNILTRDAGGREAWVYDRVSSDVELSGTSLGLGGLGSAAGSSVAGLLGLTAGRRSERARSSQRTLTVVVRFSAEGAVESFSWHHSRF
jgi:outer membrane protein assembly factor BamE (lipoprotein component of BamABCDE complex)